MISLLAIVFAGLFGLVVGSFLNVVAHRLPRGLSLVRPGSHCPGCGTDIAPYDNIPVLSWLLLRGRCRHCRARISPRYPVIEALTGALFALAAWRFGLTPVLLPALILIALLVALAAIDVEHLILPDILTLPGIAAGLILQPIIPGVHWLGAVVGVLAGAGTLILLINVWFFLRGEEGMGLGDVNMLAMIGAFLGWQGALVTLLAAVLTGSVVGVILMAGGRLGWRSELPFGVFLTLGGLVALFAGQEIVAAYMGWMAG